MTLEELEALVCSLGLERYRADQLFRWIYQKGVRDFSSMTDLSKELRGRMKEIAFIGSLKTVKVSESPNSGTRKFLFQLEDGLKIESVFIPEDKRRTLCLSTQVGCALDCRFCATGRMGFKRNLTVAEIVDQVISIERELGMEATNVVIMGMGEPFLNFENTIKAASLIADPRGISISPRKITISTCGIVPKIIEYADRGLKFNLAISLNAPDDRKRNQIMPVNKRYPLGELLRAVRYYTRKAGKRVTFEYVLIDGFNDTLQDAFKLRKLVRGIPCKINLIPYNTISGEFQAPREERIERFLQALYPLRAPITLRRSKGEDIGAACGQLCVRD